MANYTLNLRGRSLANVKTALSMSRYKKYVDKFEIDMERLKEFTAIHMTRNTDVEDDFESLVNKPNKAPDERVLPYDY